MHCQSLFLVIILFWQQTFAYGGVLDEFLRCHLCETKKPEGQIKDCNCEYQTVDVAAENFFVPLLKKLTERPFFRYFKIDFNKKCPFWSDDGQCVYESCSVCECEQDEIPPNWKNLPKGDLEASSSSSSSSPNALDEYGWVSSHAATPSTPDGIDTVSMEDAFWEGNRQTLQMNIGNKLDEYDWIDMEEEKDFPTESSVYVNLLENPERHTGYSGPSAKKVWAAIQEENCFSGSDLDSCLEKRTFYRLMSGLQASISTHIAMEYYYSDGQGGGHWGQNVPIFVKSVGSHPNRLSNLYFTFLFMVRAVAKAADILKQYNYDTGHGMDETLLTLNLIEELVTTNVTTKANSPITTQQSPSQSLYNDVLSGLPTGNAASESALLCKYGFDESKLFQSNEPSSTTPQAYWEFENDKSDSQSQQALMHEFRLRFQNISRIMDCVTCEKCRLWGKLQILGLGTAIKILLSPPEILNQDPSEVLTRQEVIALVNTMHQFSKSVKFSIHADELELQEKLHSYQAATVHYIIPLLLVASVFIIMYCLRLSMKPCVKPAGKIK